MANTDYAPELKKADKPLVVVLKVPYGKKGGVQETVKRAMKMAAWNKFVKGKNIAIKVNLISDQLIPGQCTSPWVLEGVLQQILERKPNANITICDADLAAARQCDKAAEIWGHKKLAEAYGARFVNLSKDKSVNVKLKGGWVLKEVEIPEIIMDADSIITVPVLKTHALATITCTLKHQWGIFNRAMRHQYHLVFNRTIADVNAAVKDKVRFALVDGTIGMEGNAPRTGHPRICNIVLASSDLVACDIVATKLMGIDPAMVEHIYTCATRGIGSPNYQLVSEVSNPLPWRPFALPDPEWHPIFFWELFLRRSVFKKLLFETDMFKLMSWIATQYNTVVWYILRGKKYAREIFQDSYYGHEFKPLINMHKGS